MGRFRGPPFQILCHWFIRPVPTTVPPTRPPQKHFWINFGERPYAVLKSVSRHIATLSLTCYMAMIMQLQP